MTTPIFLALSAIASGWIVLVAFAHLSHRRALLMWLVLTVAFSAMMLFVQGFLGNAGAWNIFAFVFIGLGAWHGFQVWMNVEFREKDVWEGHAVQSPETEAFSDALKLTTNNLTGAMSGLVLAGPFDERYLGDLSSAELQSLRTYLETSDPHGIALLDAYLAWRERTV